MDEKAAKENLDASYFSISLNTLSRRRLPIFPHSQLEYSQRQRRLLGQDYMADTTMSGFTPKTDNELPEAQKRLAVVDFVHNSIILVDKMSGFSEVAMRERLAKLRPQQDSINTLSLWLMHHHRHMDDIVQIWLKEVRKETNSSQIVNLLYVANDVIQNSRKKNPEFMTKFYGVLEPAFRHAAKISGPELDKAMIKTLNVWRDRQIYNEEQLAPLDAVIKRRKSSSNSGSNSHLAHVHAPLIPELFPASAAPPPPEYDSESVSTNVTEVLESLRKLDYPPSADAEVRHKIASYSEMIATPQSLDTIRNSAEAKKLLAEIDEAEPLVKEYCQRLADEMLERRNLQKLFDDMIVNVRATVDLHETLLKEVRRKEERARNDLAEVRKAFDSLPDLTEVTEDAPLPSLENLFDL